MAAIVSGILFEIAQGNPGKKKQRGPSSAVAQGRAHGGHRAPMRDRIAPLMGRLLR